ncbi:MAG TPA: phosphatase PAP2 family protein [Streptosporangiaceae bacterium]
MLQIELSWQQAGVIAGCLLGSAGAMRLAAHAPAAQGLLARGIPARWARRVARAARVARTSRWARLAGFVQEAGTMVGLFALWQLAGSKPLLSTAGAVGRGRWLWHAERVLHMPSEAVVQRAFLPHPLLVQASNLYYAGLHFVVLIGCLAWVFARHRASYSRVRTTVVLFTGFALLVQLIPVAPPRLLAGDGMVDTAVRYGQSVYGSYAGFNPDQLSAMPSVHIGWALLVAVVVVHVSHSRWRWLALGYPALTTLAVVVTANHYWLDGVAAAILLALALLLQRAGQAAWRKLRRRRGHAVPVPPEPAPMATGGGGGD